MSNYFNLIDEPWIPIVAKELISLKQLFRSSPEEYPELGGNPIQKIAVTKLLLAIAQSAYTPADEESWHSLGVNDLASRCLTYLDKWHDAFYLYGEKPFLQMPEIKHAKAKDINVVLPEVATGNASYIFQTQNKKDLTDADKAIIIVTLMSFVLGGKNIDSKISKYEKKSAHAGPSLGQYGYLHNLILGSNVLETVWLNLFTHEQLSKKRFWSSGLGVAPWEEMPKDIDCPVARKLKESYLGRLVPLSRFCLFSGNDLHYAEGIRFSGYKEGGVDPSVAVDRSKEVLKAKWVDPEKRPWRMVPAFLSYACNTKSADCYECIFIQEGLARVKKLPIFGIWSGGLRVSDYSGEQKVLGSNDFLESKVFLSTDLIGNSDWFWKLEEEMVFLDQLSKIVDSSVKGYYAQLKANNTEKYAKIASNLFWQLCEKHSQELLRSETPKNLRSQFKNLVKSVYDHLCSRDTSRQINSWACNRSKMLKKIGFYEQPRN